MIELKVGLLARHTPVMEVKYEHWDKREDVPKDYLEGVSNGRGSYIIAKRVKMSLMDISKKLGQRMKPKQTYVMMYINMNGKRHFEGKADFIIGSIPEKIAISTGSKMEPLTKREVAMIKRLRKQLTQEALEEAHKLIASDNPEVHHLGEFNA